MGQRRELRNPAPTTVGTRLGRYACADPVRVVLILIICYEYNVWKVCDLLFGSERHLGLGPPRDSSYLVLPHGRKKKRVQEKGHTS